MRVDPPHHGPAAAAGPTPGALLRTPTAAILARFSIDVEGALAMERSLYYHVADPDGTRLISSSPERIRRRLRDGASWPPGQYTVFVTDSEPTWLRPPGDRWGVVAKHADGSVELLTDRLLVSKLCGFSRTFDDARS